MLAPTELTPTNHSHPRGSATNLLRFVRHCPQTSMRLRQVNRAEDHNLDNPGEQEYRFTASRCGTVIIANGEGAHAHLTNCESLSMILEGVKS